MLNWRQDEPPLGHLLLCEVGKWGRSETTFHLFYWFWEGDSQGPYWADTDLRAVQFAPGEKVLHWAQFA